MTLHYVAWVIPPTGDIAVVDLGEAAKIDDAVHAALRIIPTTADRSREIGERRAEQMAHESLQRISELVLKPINSHLKDVNHLIISPDGDLWLVPWAARLQRRAVSGRIVHAAAGREFSRPRAAGRRGQV